MEDITQLAEVLLTHSDGTQVVAWEHHLAEKLAKHLLAILGGDPAEVPDWGNADFDSIYIVRVTGHDKNRRATFSHEDEGLNDLPDSCGH
jgi:hypothetical protein